MSFQQHLAKLRGVVVITALPLTTIAQLPTAAEAASLSAQLGGIYVFGDSLSDTGNSFDVIGIPPSPPYSQGRFSNGKIWVEYLADELGLSSNQQINFAFGGATTGTANTLIPGVQGLPGLQQQIESFTAANTSADSSALYTIWAGANDYLGNGVTDPTIPVANLSTAVSSLSAVGAKNIMVVNLPDLGQLPGTRGSQNAAGLDALTEAHNSLLAANLNFLSQQNPDLNIIPLDVNDLVSRAIADPGEFGFENVEDSCLTSSGICSNQDEYLFWDAIHPTTDAHKLLGELAYSNVQPVPEPAAEWAVLALGAVGAVSILKRKQQKASIKAGSSQS